MSNQTYYEKLIATAGKYGKEKEYWLTQLGGDLIKSHLIYDYKKKPGKINRKSLDVVISGEVFDRLIKIINKSDVRLHIILVAAVALLVRKYTGIKDVTLGSVIYKQESRGEFINTLLVLRNYLRENMSFKELILQVRQTVVEADKNANFPIETLLYQLDMEDNQDGFPLFDIAVILENIQDRNYIGNINHNLSYFFKRTPHHIQLNIEYNSLLYIEKTIKRQVEHLRNLLRNAFVNVDININHLEIISAAEKKQVLYDFNDTAVSYPQHKTIYRVMAEQVEQTPDNIAVVGRGQGVGTARSQYLTYRELNKRSGQLGHLLRAKGIKPDTIVAIMVDRSLEIMIGILGILKAGGAFLPIDPAFPPKRINYILKDSCPSLLLTNGQFKPEIKNSCEILNIDESDLYQGEAVNPEAANHLHIACYVIYTSGSTGKPKGVMIKNNSLVNFIKGITDIIDFEEKDNILSLTTQSFDIFYLETLLPLTKGCKVIIGGKREQSNLDAFTQAIYREIVTILQLTPSRLLMIISDEPSANCLKSLKYLLVGGENFPEPLLDRTREFTTGTIFNLYGPTETTIWSTVKRLDKGEPLNIGKPIANTRVYIVDKSGTLQPIGVAGELRIGGEGLARGYLNRPGLTAEKFCLRQPGGVLFEKTAPVKHLAPPRKNFFLKGSDKDHMQSCNHASMQLSIHQSPHSPIPPFPHSPLYRTGDLAVWLPDGNIEFLGRQDNQIKLRGYRIELAEIERQLARHENIKEAVVIAREGEPGNKYLCAYIVPGDNSVFHESELRDHLSGSLPDYMMPAYFVPLGKIPLNPNGKVARNQLPAPETVPTRGYTAPESEMERKVVQLWADVLQLDKKDVGVETNFFELGGQSLKAISLITKIWQSFQVDITLTQLFKIPTVRGIANYIESHAKDTSYVSIELIEKRKYYPLSSAQKRLFFLNRVVPDSIVYNMPAILVLNEKLNRKQLQETLQKLIQRHESLRTSFDTINDTPVQRIWDKVEFEIQYHDLEKGIESNGKEDIRTGYPVSPDEYKKPVEAIVKRFVRPFNLSKAPLLRAGLIRVEETKFVIMADMHHIVSDVASWEIFESDFIRLYRGEEVPPRQFQYRDFSGWQTRQKGTDQLKKQEAFWLEKFADDAPVLDLPTDFPRPDLQRFEGNWITFEIGNHDTQKLKKLAREEDATTYMVLLGLYYILLAKLSGQEDIVVGTHVLGRKYKEFQQIIGMFVNTIALPMKVPGEKNFLDLLEQVKTNALEAFDNQDYQFEDLIDKISIKRSLNRNPLFDAAFNFQTLETTPTPVKGSSLSSFQQKQTTSKFDMTLYASEEAEKLIFHVEYSISLFKTETIHRFINYFKEILKYVANNKQCQLKDIPISYHLKDAEAGQLTIDFRF